MGGQAGSRGYLYQGVASIFNACTESNWNEISVEYTTQNDKVDIALIEANGTVARAVQVKSSVNLFCKSDIQHWIKSLANDVIAKEYQVILIGNCKQGANTFIKSIEKYYSEKEDSESEKSIEGFRDYLKDKFVSIILLPFDEKHLMGVVRDSINCFLGSKGYTINFSALEQIAYALVSLNMFLSTNGKNISKEAYENKIIKWLNNTANGGMKKTSDYSTLVIKAYDKTSQKLSDKYVAESFINTEAFINYKNKLLCEGENFIHQISAISLPSFEKAEKPKPVDPAKLSKYIKSEITSTNFEAFRLPVKSEINEKDKKQISLLIKKYWDIDISAEFYNVGNLTGNSILSSITGKTEYYGTEIEKRKNSLINQLRWKICILKSINYLAKIMCKVQLIPLCIVNADTISDKNISVSISACGDGFHLFNIQSDINKDDKIMLEVLADTLIDEDILENILAVKANTNIDIKTQKSNIQRPFVMPDLFGRRRRYDFEDFVNNFSIYQAEEDDTGTITYEFSVLRPGEAKWLSPYMMIIAEDKEIHIDYTILSENLGRKKSGIIVLDINNH